MKTWNIDKDWLEQKYLVDNLSTHKIAKLLGCGSKTISLRLHEYNIPVRTIDDAVKLNRTGEYVSCSNCGESVYRKRYNLNKFNVFFCSWKCEKEYQSKTRRTSQLAVGWRRFREYKVWRKLVFTRDNNICKLCSSDKNLVAHHILEARYYPELIYEVSNGVCLCNSCHKVLHKNYSIQLIKSLQEEILVE